MERDGRIELPAQVWKTWVLPLYESRIYITKIHDYSGLSTGFSSFTVGAANVSFSGL